MKLQRSERFKREFQSLPATIQRRAEKQLALFLNNSRHPSLRIKKMQGIPGIWEGRITRSYRFTFELHNDLCILLRIGTHDILITP
jgi:mRNA interferase RelE/StbE